MTARSLARQNRDASYYVVRYICDNSIQLRQRSNIKYDGCVRVGEAYPTQWGALRDIDDALVLHGGDYMTMRQIEQQEKSRLDAESSDIEWSPLPSPHQSPPMSSSEPASPVPPAPKRPRLQGSKTTVVKNLATVIGRGSPASTLGNTTSESDPAVTTDPSMVPNSPLRPALPSEPFQPSALALPPVSLTVPTLPTPIPAIQTTTPVSPITGSRDGFTFTGSPEPPTTPTLSILTASRTPGIQTSTPHTTPRSTTIVLSKFQTQMMRMMGEISKKQDVILRRLSNLENTQSTILASVQRLQAAQAEQTTTIPTAAPETEQALETIPEPYRIEIETLRGINSRSFGAGNFAKRLTVRLFPELFGVDDLRLQYSFYGGGCNRKKPLELQRREVIRVYVCNFYPEVRPVDTWNAMVVSKINEGLRRPSEKKSRPRKRPTMTVLDVPSVPQCDDPVETFIDNGLEYTRL